MDKTRVFNIDCMEGMKEFPDKYFELAIVDPPYGIGEDGGAQRTRGSKKTNGIKKNWDSLIPKLPYFLELKRVSQNQIIWGANYFGTEPSKSFIIWDKLDYGSDFADCEFAWSSFNSAARIYKQSRQSNQDRPDDPRIHPTQKPIKLYKWLLKNYAKEGDKILDTHLGSQSSRIAAFDMGFDFTGYELDKDYFEAGNKRFNQHKSQLKLFS
jgi:site-specific DNA-methyltransferase (adenine-specific)